MFDMVYFKIFQDRHHGRFCVPIVSVFQCHNTNTPPHTMTTTGIASIEWFAEEAKRVCGDDLASTLRNRRMQVWKEPIGVVGAITVGVFLGVCVCVCVCLWCCIQTTH